MLTPTTGDILHGIHRELQDQVLTELPRNSAAVRQLRSALHALQQAACTWDLQHTYLAGDNADLEATLVTLRELSGLTSRKGTIAIRQPSGTTDAHLRDLITLNLELQAELVAFQCDWRCAGTPDENVERTLIELHQRLVTRATVAAGVSGE